MFPTIQKTSFCLMALIMSMLITLTAVAEDTDAQFENLEPVGDPQVAVAYIDPNADFSVFKRVMIL